MTSLKLADPERTLLARAAAAEDGFADAFEGEAKVAASLIRRGLMIRISAGDAPARMMVTAKGRSGLDPTPLPLTENGRGRAPKVVPASQLAGAVQEASAPTISSGKLGLVASLLNRPQGATIAELVAATGWQAHSVRGAISGALKKHRKLNVVSVKADGARTYRIEAAAGA